MSSPAPVSPGPVPSPPRIHHPRSLAGPVVLIAIGCLFLAGTMGLLRWEPLGRLFAHYWPVLLILWGIIKLLEHLHAQRTGVRSAGIGAGGVFLLILLIGFGLAATQASRFNWEGLRNQIDIDDSDFPMFGHTYNFDDELQQAFPSGDLLRVVNDHGAVNVSASNDNQIHVAVHKRVSAESQEDAAKWNSQTKSQISVSGQTVTLDANTQGAGDHPVTSDLDVAVPRKSSVVISTRRGDVSVMGRDGDVDISSQKGDVSASDISGKVKLHLSDSSARISQIASDVSVDGRANDVSIEDVKGGAHLDGEFMESLKLAKIAGATTFKSSRTEMEFGRIDGTVDLDSGDLQANRVTGPVRVQTRSKDISLEGVSGDARVHDENGAVELHFSKLGSLEVDNRSGDIDLYLPEKASFQVDAHARNGEVHSDFSDLKVENNDDEGSASGGTGGGGPHLVVNNEHGSIELHKGSAVAEAPEPPLGSPHPPKPPAPPKVTEN